MISMYYALTKPGIVLGNIVTVTAGFILASKGVINIPLFLATVLGIAFVMASACVFNNYFDRHADQKMARTKNRALPQGLISLKSALTFAALLGLCGIAVLFFYTNTLTAFIAFFGFFFYVVMYGIWKYKSVYGTLVGSVAGAVPPLVGYCAVSNRLDAGAIILFLIMVLWQMPHFYAIAMYRFDDYAAASIPVLPVKKGMYVTKVHMLLYIIAFMIATWALIAFGYVGYAYLVVATLAGATWLILGFKGFSAKNDKIWARQMFRVSLVVVMALSAMISFDWV
ncbi:MAG: heme o synthase [Chlamydiota bacterium]